MKTRMSLSSAKSLAKSFISAIEDVCERVEVAGSIRRECREVGDVEIVCIPKRKPDLFGGPGDSELDPRISKIAEKPMVTLAKNGPKYKQIQYFVLSDETKREIEAAAETAISNANKEIPGPVKINPGSPPKMFQVDLFIADWECFPLIMAIRTGPAEFSKSLVTPISARGKLAEGFNIRDGQVWDHLGHAHNLMSEKHFFEQYIQGGWVEPKDR